MQSIRQCVKHLTMYAGKSAINRTNILSSAINLMPICGFHISATCCKSNSLSKYKTPSKFLDYNKTIFPPQQPDEERRPAVSHIYVTCMFVKY